MRFNYSMHVSCKPYGVMIYHWRSLYVQKLTRLLRLQFTQSELAPSSGTSGASGADPPVTALVYSIIMHNQLRLQGPQDLQKLTSLLRLWFTPSELAPSSGTSRSSGANPPVMALVYSIIMHNQLCLQGPQDLQEPTHQ